MTWRDKFRPIIARVLAAHAGADDRAIRRALRDEWNRVDGIRQHWPYKVWLDEIRVQRGRRVDVPRRRVRVVAVGEVQDDAQGRLF